MGRRSKASPPRGAFGAAYPGAFPYEGKVARRSRDG